MPQQPYVLMGAEGSDIADEVQKIGVAVHSGGNLPLAQHCYNLAMRLNPRHALAQQNLAVIMAQSNMLKEARLAIERASDMDGVCGAINVNWSIIAMEFEDIDEALKQARKGVQLAPDDTNALLALAMVLPAAGMPEEAVPIYNKILDKDPKNIQAGVNACFVQTLTSCGPEELLKQRKRWYEANKPLHAQLTHGNDPNPDRKLRVGYVGGDFKSHSAAFIFAHVILNHSDAIETYLYSSLPVDAEKDMRTKKFQDKCKWTCTTGAMGMGTYWRDIQTLNSDQAAELIRRDKIDILVDLAAHTNGGRLDIFTRKPAPVQVTAWGFAHGSGLPEMDYFFADPIAVPEAERQFYEEEIIDLPCIVTMAAPVEYNLPASSKAPFKQNDCITFGCFTRYEKLSGEALQAFAEIMRRVPYSRLLFKDQSFRRPYSERRILQAMAGIDKSRLLFRESTDHRDHMLAYQSCDIILNPFWHSSGVVTLEVLWMGVPMITLYGTQAAGRTAASVLSILNHGDWIGYTPAEYVEKAVALANDHKQLVDCRKTLRDELMNSPVVKDYVVAVEAAYRQIWGTWCAAY